MSRQPHSREIEINYGFSNLTQTHALNDLGSVSDGDRNVNLNLCSNFIEGVDDRKPRPLDPNRGRHRTFKADQAQHPLYFGSGSKCLSDGSDRDHSHRHDQKGVDFNHLNKPLPIEPGLVTGREASQIESTKIESWLYDNPETSSNYTSFATSPSSLDSQHVNQSEKGLNGLSNFVPNITATEDYQNFDPGGRSRFETYWEEQKDERAASDEINKTKIEFPQVLDGKIGKHTVPQEPRGLMTKVKRILTLRLSPDHPPSAPEFDRGRLLGLRLEDNSTLTVNRGFGLLWVFWSIVARIRDKWPSQRVDVNKKTKHAQRIETEHMLQIWNALKSLLLKQSAERQGPGQADRAGENVITFMKRGMGEIQQYLTGSNSIRV
ncbi:hypothetical protein N7523_005595 [Penicillium sp. IBT 18751x]|nr:hypothetical protein N7523_005595 [Penicillium sp. IBT 18751x]